MFVASVRKWLNQISELLLPSKKVKITQDQYNLIKALSTGKALGKQIDTVDFMGTKIPIFELVEYDIEEDLKKRYEIIDPKILP